MAEPAQTADADLELIREVHRELEARRGTLTNDEIFALLARLPQQPVPPGLSAAEIIRELRGPLPDDDPEFQRNFGRR